MSLPFTSLSASKLSIFLLFHQSSLLITLRWDDWVPEDRLRKLSPENRELANNLRHEVLAAQRAAAAKPAAATKKKPQGSARGSEERQSSVSAAVPRGQKRMRDQDLEKVSSRSIYLRYPSLFR